MVPPWKKVRQKGRPARRLCRRNCPIATSSSTAKGIMISMATAATRQSVQ
jgi:hypothetical protein